ncbi:MAG: apolipoprotein N-acyltransferase [Bauldia sp.]
MQSIANAIIVLWGWRRFVVAVGAGAVSALALAPFKAFPVLWVTLPVFVWLIDGAVAPAGAGPIRRLMPAALIGWSFGFGFFVAGLWWIGVSFLVDAGKFAWLLPLPVLALPAALALFWSFGAALARLFWRDGWSRILVFAAAMSGAEFLRGHLFTGFPWNAPGYALAPAPVMMQSAALVGLWGLTLAAFVIFAAPAVFASAGDRRSDRGRAAFLVFAGLLLVAHVGFGAWRLAQASDAIVPGVHLRIVQPAIEQGEKWQAENANAIFARNLELSRSPTADGRDGMAGVTYLIWPETAVPFLLTERPDALSAIGTLLPDGASLLTGAIRAEPPEAGESDTRYFNSVEILGDDGAVLAAYDKVNLVPFGEFLPFQDFLEGIGLRQLTELPGGFSAGPRRRTLPLPAGPPVGPLICYETIFPGAAVDATDRPGWLLNVTNDAWFGDTPGPRQHLEQARLRAVEEGLPLVRAANSGISAVVDPYGRLVKSLSLGRSGVIDSGLPSSLPPTPYARWGDAVFAILLGCAAFGGLFIQFMMNFRRN